MANISEAMTASRIISHGKITSLEAPFEFSAFNPFSIFVVPKANVAAGVISAPDNAGLLVNCKCFQDETSSGVPILFNQWNECAIIEIAANAIDLAVYDVYWGAGVNVSES